MARQLIGLALIFVAAFTVVASAADSSPSSSPSGSSSATAPSGSSSTTSGSPTSGTSSSSAPTTSTSDGSTTTASSPSTSTTAADATAPAGHSGRADAKSGTVTVTAVVGVAAATGFLFF